MMEKHFSVSYIKNKRTSMIINSRIETTIDYPGKMGQIVFTSGCNFRCKFCHNPELAEMQDKGLDIEKILKDLKIKAEAGWYEGVCISGGGANTAKRPADFIEKIKNLSWQ